MDRLVKQIFRFWQQRRATFERKRRISNLVANSNCIGTTANLFNDDRPRAITGDLMAEKKPDCNRTIKY